MKKSLLPLLFISCLSGLVSQIFASERVPAEIPVAEKTAHDAKMQWFRDAHFGLFIHWGLYSQYAGVWKGKDARTWNGCAEWMMLVAKAPREEYATGAKDFNPIKFDADAWVRTAKVAGAKYIIITSKHHDGFAMFKSTASKYNIVDATPFKRDPIKELAEACKKHGIRLGFYYSQNLDWYHPGGAGGEWDPTHKGSPDAYLEKIAIPQIKEILTNYGDISVLWYDMGNGGIMTPERATRIKNAVHEIAPGIITNNRLGGGVSGDIQTPENTIPPTGIPGKDWEVCMTMNHTWGFCEADTDWKSPQMLIRTLCDITSKGGNLLLNVGPTGAGEIPQASLERLEKIGAWIRDYGTAIYGTRASIFSNLPAWGRWTTRAGTQQSTLYALVFDVPESCEISLPGLQNKILRAYELKSKTPCTFSGNAGMQIVKISENFAKEKDFVIAVEIAGTPTIEKEIYAEQDGKFYLLPLLADCTGGVHRQEFSMNGLKAAPEERLVFGKGEKDSATWKIKLTKSQKFEIFVRYAALANSVGTVLTLDCGNENLLDFEIKSTGDLNKFLKAKLGEITLPAGIHTLVLRPKRYIGKLPYNIGIITLTPIDAEN